MFIQTEDLVKAYKERNAVNGVSIRVDQGQIVGLLGPNGAGKTTTFYMIVGIERPTSGRITIDGKDITNLPIHKRAAYGIGYLPQEASIFRKLTVEENIMAILEQIEPDKAKRLQKMEDLIQEFHIDHIRKSKGSALSGGERRRVEIARALATDPGFILMDETFAGIGPIAVAAYSYMALVPIIQPFAIRLVTTRKERCIHMEYNPKSVNKQLRIAFPIAVTIIVGLISPQSVALVGFLMFGNLLRECGVLGSLSQTAQNEFANIITLLLGITISFSMRAEQFVNPATLMIMVLGLVAFVFDTIGGVLFAKLINVFLKMAGKKPVNPMIGGCGISAFPMSSRVVQRMAAREEPGNIILMQAAGTNVSGQVASVIAGGLVISIVSQYL